MCQKKSKVVRECLACFTAVRWGTVHCEVVTLHTTHYCALCSGDTTHYCAVFDTKHYCAVCNTTLQTLQYECTSSKTVHCTVVNSRECQSPISG